MMEVPAGGLGGQQEGRTSEGRRKPDIRVRSSSSNYLIRKHGTLSLYKNESIFSYVFERQRAMTYKKRSEVQTQSSEYESREKSPSA